MARHTEAIFTRVQQFVTQDLLYNMEPVCLYVRDSNCLVIVATLPYLSVSRVLKLCIIALFVLSSQVSGPGLQRKASMMYFLVTTLLVLLAREALDFLARTVQ